MKTLIQTINLNPFPCFNGHIEAWEKSIVLQVTCLSLQANLISEDIESAISDSKGGKQKRRPDALR